MSREHIDVSLKWIFTLPIDWTPLKAKYCGSFSGNGVDKKIRDNEDLYESVHYMDVYRNSLNELCYSDSFLTVSADKNKANISKLQKGDILITNSSETPEDMGHSTMIGEGFEDTLQGYHLMRFRPKQILDSHYLLFYLGSHLCRSWFSLMSTGITRYGVSKSAFTELPILVPSFEIQKKIAGLLDVKINTINSIERQTKSTIENYKLLKQSIITEAVTKGLDKNVEMKDSGIEWVGRIPKHWEVVKIKHLFDVINERNENEGAILLSLFTALGVAPRSEMEDKGNKASTVINYKIVKKGDLIVNKLLAWMGAVAFSDYNGVTSPDYDVYRLKRNSNAFKQYYEWYFRFTNFKDDCYKYGRGIMMMRWRTYSSEFKMIDIVNPPYSEQVEIYEYLKLKVREIDALIEKKNRLLLELETYKKSLIYEYVTGKKEVE